MIGSNSLILNQAEMIRAVEYYLNNVQFKETVRVTAVEEKPSDRVFNIRLDEPVENLDEQSQK